VGCSVGLWVAAWVEAVAVGGAGACLDRSGAADLREGCFAVEALDVVAGGDEELACALGADSVRLCGAWGGGADKPLELAVELCDLAVELADATARLASASFAACAGSCRRRVSGRGFRQRATFALMVRPWRSSLRSVSVR
jgi:hypothetical protein